MELNTMSKTVDYADLPYELSAACRAIEARGAVAESAWHDATLCASLHPTLRALHQLANTVDLPFCGDADSDWDDAVVGRGPVPIEARSVLKACTRAPEDAARNSPEPACCMQLDKLSRVNPALAASMVADYLRNTSILMWEIGDIATLPSWSRLAQIAAALRASSTCMGVNGMAQLFGELELAVRRQDLIEFIDVFGRVLDAFPAVSESLLRLGTD